MLCPWHACVGWYMPWGIWGFCCWWARFGDGEDAELLSNMGAMRSLRRFPGAMPWRPCSEQSHQPSKPPVFCSITVRMSPLRNASSSGDSGTLSYSAFAIWFCRARRNGMEFMYDQHLLLHYNELICTYSIGTIICFRSCQILHSML